MQPRPIPHGFNPDALTPPPLADERSPRVSSLTLDLAGSCNLSCRYCVESATQPTRPAMPDETLLQAWDWFCRDGAPPNVGSIHIGSGEPLLAEPMLRKVGDLVRHSHGCGGESGVVVHLTTNGTVMTNPCRR